MANGGGLGAAWCLVTAIEHVERIEAYEREQDFYRIVSDEEAIEIGSYPAADAQKRSPTQLSIDGLLLALRDGYVRATGRRSTTRGSCTAAGTETWRLHATDPFLITTEEWRSGDFDFERLALTGRSWQYIQIEVPDFMVKGIWPDWHECDGTRPKLDHRLSPYTTPYLELMQAAINRFGLTEENQSKKENLSDWFLEQPIEGERISRNLADAMATLIRLPSAQRGGAKRVLGPDFRRAG